MCACVCVVDHLSACICLGYLLVILTTRSLCTRYSANQDRLIQPHAHVHGLGTCICAAFIQCSLPAVHLWAYVPSHAQMVGVSRRAVSLLWSRRMYGREEVLYLAVLYSFLGLAYGTDLQEQGSSHTGSCCNKGIAKTATTGVPYLRTCTTPRRERHDGPLSSTQYLLLSIVNHVSSCRENMSSPPANLSSQLALMPCYLFPPREQATV